MATLAAALAIASPAPAAGEDVISDCLANNGLTGKYTSSQLNAALQNIPADVDEYFDCRAIIRGELSKLTRKEVPPPKILAPGKQNKAQLAKIERQVERQLRKKSGDTATNVAGTKVEPGAGKTLESAAEPGMPGTMALAIFGIALLGVAEFGGRIRKKLAAGDETGNHPS